MLGPSLPAEDALLTGVEMAERVLEPLAASAPLRGRVRTGHRVVAVGRARMTRAEMAGHPLRAERPFRLLVDGPEGEYAMEAEAVLDASGVYDTPAAVGAGGVPARGERAMQPLLVRHLGTLEERLPGLAGRDVLLVGHGHSAANAIGLLERLSPSPRVVWATRSPNRRPCVEVAGDPLPERRSVVARANALAADPPAFLRVERRASVEAIEPANGQLAVSLSGDRGGRFDAVVGFTGYRPDLSFLSELALEISPVSEGALRLHRAIAGVTDCLAAPARARGRPAVGRARLSPRRGQEPTGGSPRSCCGRATRSSSPCSTSSPAAGERLSLRPALRPGHALAPGGGHALQPPVHPLLRLLLAHEPQPRDDEPRRRCARYLAEAEALGVQEYYFTGGEPFLNREILEMLDAALALGPVTVLTNGVLIKPETAARLRRLSDASDYSLDLRISIDGWDAATNDPVRGAGTFERILEGIRHLVAAGLDPVVTVTEACVGGGHGGGPRAAARLPPRPRASPTPPEGHAAAAARRRGSTHPRVRGRGEPARRDPDPRRGGGARSARRAGWPPPRGVYVCPILVDSPAARMGATLAETLPSVRARATPPATPATSQGLSCRT